jgi:integrase
VYVAPPKTRASVRTVPLPRPATDAVVRHMNNHTLPGVDAWVFGGPDGHVLRAGLFRRRHWTPAVRTARLEPLTFHTLRHVAVSLWAAAGASPSEVAARAGHRSVITVLDRYRHLFADEYERTTARLEEMYVETPLPGAPVVDLRG